MPGNCPASHVEQTRTKIAWYIERRDNAKDNIGAVAKLDKRTIPFASNQTLHFIAHPPEAKIASQ